MITSKWMRIVLAFAILFLAGWPCTVDGQTKPAERIEILDMRHWDFSKRLAIKGHWSFIENKLVAPQNLSKEDLNYASFPSLWNEQNEDGTGLGCATYALNILVPDTLTRLALEIPQMYSSYAVWINGQLLTSAGTVACEKDGVSPQWIYQMKSFTNTSDTVELVLQVANFHHYKGGAMNPIYLGNADSIRAHYNWSIGSNVFEASILFLESIFFLFFYKRNKRNVVLYFSLLCLTWSVRSVFSNIYPLMLVYPGFSWQWLVKIEYVTLYLTVIWASLFFGALFGDISNKIFTYLPVALNLFFTLFTLLTPALVFTRWVSVYLFVAALVIIYAVVLIVRALINDQKGSWFLISSIWVGVLIFGYDIVAYQSSFSYNVVLLNIGYVVIFLLTTVALLYHLEIFNSRVIEKDVLTMKDLYGPNRNI